MFNLEHAIANWRRQMLAAGIKAPCVVDELESHLREEVDYQMQSGLSEEKSFQAAVERIGKPNSLSCEFGKVGGKKWAFLRALKGILVASLVPFPSSKTLTASARLTLELARAEAPRHQHNFVGTEHILLGLLKLENGVVPSVLQRMGLDREDVAQRVEKWISPWPCKKMRSHLPYTPRVKKALRMAVQESKAWRHDCISAEHILLGLLLEGDGVAGRVLKNLGVNIQTARHEILRELRRQQGGA